MDRDQFELKLLKEKIKLDNELQDKKRLQQQVNASHFSAEISSQQGITVGHKEFLKEETIFRNDLKGHGKGVAKYRKTIQSLWNRGIGFFFLG